MKPIERDTTRQGSLTYRKTAVMGVAKGALAEILNNQIEMYNKPYIAALREYTSNARDAHRAAGHTGPVYVELPSELSPNLIIRDYGVGLNEVDMELFGQFGESTKQTSNDDIGGFGLGSKSGLAIASRFTVSSVKDGIRNTAIVHRDEHGAPTMGWISEPEAVDQPNGVTISIPTMESEKFIKAINKGMFIGWEPGTIDIVGDVQPLVSLHGNPDFEYIEEAGWIWSGKGEKPFQANAAYGLALIAGVSFPIDWSQVNSSLPEAIREGLLSQVILDIPNGANEDNEGVSMLRSREGLIYNRTTTRIVNEVVQRLIERGAQVFQDQIDAAESFKDAFTIFVGARAKGYRTVDFTYQGEVLAERVLPFTEEIEKLVQRTRDTRWDTQRFAVTPVQPQSKNIHWCHYNARAMQVNRTEEHLAYRYYNAVDAVSILKRGHTVLVVECDAMAAGSPTNKLKEVSTVSVFFASKKRTEGIKYGELNVHFLSYSVDHLNPDWVSLFDEVITAEEYRERNRVERRQQAADRRANRPESGRTATVSTRTRATKQQVKVLDRVSPKRLSFENAKDVATLDQSKRYVVLRPDVARDVEIRRVLTTKVARANNNALLNAVYLLQQRLDFDIVVHNKSDRKPEGLQNVVTFDELVSSAWAASKASLTEDDIRTVKEAQVVSAGVKRLADEEYLEKIKSTETQEWLKRIASEDDTDAIQMKIYAESDFQRHMAFARLVPAGETRTDYLDMIYTQKVEGFYWNRYPILVSGGRYDNYTKEQLEDVIFYINSKDDYLLTSGK